MCIKASEKTGMLFLWLKASPMWTFRLSVAPGKIKVYGETGWGSGRAIMRWDRESRTQAHPSEAPLHTLGVAHQFLWNLALPPLCQVLGAQESSDLVQPHRHPPPPSFWRSHQSGSMKDPGVAPVEGPQGLKELSVCMAGIHNASSPYPPDPAPGCCLFLSTDLSFHHESCLGESVRCCFTKRGGK